MKKLTLQKGGKETEGRNGSVLFMLWPKKHIVGTQTVERKEYHKRDEISIQ